MHPQSTTPTSSISQPYLSSLDVPQLIDLLQDRTQLLLTARLPGDADKIYLKLLQKEVELIQQEIGART
jgi:hypothetical protein